MRTLAWLALGSLVLVTSARADRAAGLRWTAPTGWRAEPIRTTRPDRPPPREDTIGDLAGRGLKRPDGIERAQAVRYSVPALSPEHERAEVVVFPFAVGDRLGVEAQLERWRDTLLSGTGWHRTTQRFGALEVAMVEASGNRRGPSMVVGVLAVDKTPRRLIGAIVETQLGLVLYQITGPGKTVAAARAGLNELLSSLSMDGPPSCPSAAEARERAAGDRMLPDQRLTLALPSAWPAGGVTSVRYLAHRVSARPTGIVSYAVFSPEHEITVPLDGATPRTRRIGPARKLGVDSPEAKDAPASITQAEAALVRAICEARPPSEAEAATIREGYRAWLAREPLLKPFVEREAGAFLAWVNEAPAPPR